MRYMFFKCSTLKSIDLSSFIGTKETLTEGMLAFCDSLMFIDVSNLFLKEKLDSIIKTDTFEGQEYLNIEFINVHNSAIISEDIYNFTDFSLQVNPTRTIYFCFNDDISSNLAEYIYYSKEPKKFKDHIKKCCDYDYYNYKCNETNYITVYFNNEFNYTNGFYNDYRINIGKIVLDYSQKELTEPLKITNISELKIYFNDSTESLQSFFNSKYDTNVKYIKSIDFSNLDSSKITDMSYLLYGCTSLESVSLVNINTSLVKSFNSMFRDCKSLKSLDLSYFDTSSAEDMGQMFSRCQSLEYIDLSSFNTTLVKAMQNMFFNCSSLEYLDLSHFDTSLVNNMMSMFSNCKQLKVLDISSFNMIKIDSRNGENMFSNLLNLGYINIYNVKNTKDYIKQSILKDIDNLTICQKEDIIISTKNAYYNCCYYDILSNICESYNYMLIYYDQDVTYEKGFSNNSDSEIDAFREEDYFIINNIYNYKINKTSELVVKKRNKLEVYFKSNITNLKNYFNVFNDPNAQYIKKVDLSHLDFSSVTTTFKMFYNCRNLQSVYFSNKEITSLTNMNMMFYNCSSLEDVELSYFNTSLVEDMGSMFEGCVKIEILDLSFFDTSSVQSMNKMFYGCQNLKYLDISSFNLESIDNIENIFIGTNNLKYLNLYNMKNYDDNFKSQEIKAWENPIVCQKEKIMTQDDIIEDCCYFTIENTTCKSSNFIILYFKKETIYEKGFIADNEGNRIRGEEIDFIINREHSIKFRATDKLIIKKGRKIEIYFKPGITTLESYFSVSKDANMENIVSIDLSHLNTSSVKNMASMFYGCHSLKSIDLYDTDTSSVEDMNNMFKDCISLEMLDLSCFDTSLVTNMDSMFNGCQSLIYLDIYHFNLEKISKFNSVFTGADNLLYVNLYRVKNSYDNITNSELNYLEEVTICQKEYLITNENATYNCCYYDTEKKECINDNFAVIYFAVDTTYEQGQGFKYGYREGIDFIINRDHNSRLSDTVKFSIKKGHKIEVYFSQLKSLEGYFGSYFKCGDGEEDFIEDLNMKNVISIDLSNLKTSSVTNMKSLFDACESLKSIDLSNIDTSKVINMQRMFYDCYNLESIDLSYFDTSLVKNMNEMFYGCEKIEIIDLSYFNTSSLSEMFLMFGYCSSLKMLDISRFNLEAIIDDESYYDNYNSMFVSNYELTYINLYYVQDSKDYVTKSIKYEGSGINISKLTVCQKENVITESTDNRCCYYNIASKECENQYYVVIFFGDRAIYNSGFEKDFREGINFIINGEDHNKKLSGKDRIYLHRGSKIEIYFSDDSLSLQNYFSADKDVNMKNIVSVYLSNLNVTILNNLDNLFYGCESLKSVIDLDIFKTIPIVNMSYMFYNCISIEFIDLSSFDTSSVENMISVFQNCKSLKYLDISHFNLGNLKGKDNIKNIFKDVDDLKYINVYYVQDPDKLLLNYNYQKKFFKKVPYLMVCQKENHKIISHVNITNVCCYYEMNNDTCIDSNFVTVYFGEDVEYTSFENGCRSGNINYIINEDHNNKLSSKDTRISIKKGSKFEIHFNYPLDTLEDYFSLSCDLNMKYLVSVDLSNFDTSILTNMKSAFAGCEQLESVDLYNFKGSSIINMNFLFSNCISLKSIDFSYLEPYSIAYMNGMFSGCTSLKSIKFSTSEATSLINLEEMFKGCSSLKSIDLSKFITTSAINIEYMFSGCTSLKYLDISNFNMENVMYAVSMFENVKDLKYINLHQAKDYNSYISQSELNNLDILTVCQKEQILTKDDVINKCCKYNITTDQCDYTNYIEIYYREDVIYENGDFKNCSRKDIDYIIIGENGEHFTVSEYLDIKQNTKVEIHFKNKLKSLSNFFCSEDENTENIVSIDLSYLDTSELEDISSMFSGCSSVKSINLQYFNTYSVTNMSSLFEGCALLESIDLSFFNTSLVKDMSKMFYGCTKLTSIYLSSFDTSSVKDMSSLFYNCISIQSLDLSNFKTNEVINFNSIFSGCNNLKVLDISHFKIREDATFNNMFKNVKNLGYINLYNAVDNTKKKYLNSSLSEIKNINICQNVKERIVEYENIVERCCYYNILKDKCENSNYIVVKYGKFEEKNTINYDNGFEQNYFSIEKVREGKIDFIIYKNKKYAPTDELKIEAGSEIEIYLTNVTSLESFFNYYEIDVNAGYIESVDFSHLDASTITDMSSIFNGCYNMLSVDFSNFNSSSLITMNAMFYGCESIKTIDLSNFNTSLVTDMSSLFDGCGKLQYIYLFNLNTSKVENMNSMFSGCENLVSLDLSYFYTSYLTNVNYMFDNCKNLKVLDISHFNLDNVTDSENMKGIFSNVNSLRYINLYHVEDKNKIIQNSAISTLNDLIICQKEEIVPTKTNNRRCCYFNITENLCKSDNYIILYYGKESNYKNGFINKYRNITSFIINEYYNNTLDTNEEFVVKEGCKIELYFNSILTSLESFFDYNYDINIGNIKSIDLSHFNSLLITNMNKAFSGCTSLESINFDNFIFSSVTKANNMFFGCDSLKSIDLPLLDVSKVTDMSYMFYSCDSLKSINTTYFNISSVTKMNYMFYRCISLESIDFSFYQTSPLTNLESTFYGCKNLTSLNLSKFDTSLTTNMNKIFYGCDNLAYIDISNFNMEKCEYYSNAFSSKDKIIFINVFNVSSDKIVSEEFRKTNNIIYVCQSEDIIKNKKAVNCCEFIIDYNLCENMLTTFVTTYIQESNFIKPQSEINTIFTDKTIFTDEKLMTTHLTENNTDIDTTFVKDRTNSLIKSTNIPEETENFTDFRSTIFNEPTTSIIPEIKQSIFLEEKTQSTTTYFEETTNVLETLFDTSQIETTLINKPTNNPLIETTSLIKETTRVTPESSTQSLSTNENVIPSTNIKELTNHIRESELKTVSFTEIATSIIKEKTGGIIKTNNFVDSTSISTEKENIPITSFLEKTFISTTIPSKNQQTTSNLYSTSKEEITEKTTYIEEKTTSEREEVKTSNLEKIQTTQPNFETTGPTTSKVDIIKSNIGTIGHTTSNVDNLEPTTNINVPTTFKEDILEPTTSNKNILETTNEKVDSKEINTSDIIATSEPKQEPTTSEPITQESKQEPTTSEPTTLEPKKESTTYEPTTQERKQESNTSEPTTLEPKQEPTTYEPTTQESKQEPTTYEPTTREPKQEPTTYEPTTREPKQEPTTYEPTTQERKQEAITSQPTNFEPTISEPRQEPTTQEIIPDSTTSEPKPESSTSEPKQEPSTSKPTTYEPKQEPTTYEPRQVPISQEPIPDSTTSKQKQELSTSEPSNSEITPEPTTSEPKSELSTSELKNENTTSEHSPETTTYEPKKEPTTLEVKTTQYSVVTTSINKPKTEKILTTILNHINLTSIALTEIELPTTIIESKIKTTITEYSSAHAVLIGLSHFLQFNSSFKFLIHFRSIEGYIFSYNLTMSVQLINNKTEKILENQAYCEKVDGNLESVAYSCNVVADVSNVNSIKIEPDFNFESQDIKIVGISPIALVLMENVQNAKGKYDTLLESNYLVLDHSIITGDKRYNIFNVSGIIDNPKSNLNNINLTLIINVEKEEATLEEVNCTFININDPNYTLNCLARINILYNLQSAISFLENDILVINFDENITSEIIFYSGSNNLRKKDTSYLRAEIIVSIVLPLVIILFTLIVLIVRRKKRYKEKSHDCHDSIQFNLKTS